MTGGIWGPVETDPPAQLFLGASRPTSPVAEVTAIVSVVRMLRVARVSIPLTALSESQFALGVVLGEDRALSEIPLVLLARARPHAAGNVLALRVATWLRTGGLQASAGRRRWMVPERAAALISCAPSIAVEPEVLFVTLADRIFLQEIKDEVDPSRPFLPGRQRPEVVELTFGSANDCTLLSAERSALPPCQGGGSISLTSSIKRGFPSWVFRRHDAEGK